MSEDYKDCLECRLISGGGLIGGGTYVLVQSKRFKKWNQRGLVTIGSGLCIAGLLRVFNLPPFRHHNTSEKSLNVGKSQEEEYITGKFYYTKNTK